MKRHCQNIHCLGQVLINIIYKKRKPCKQAMCQCSLSVHGTPQCLMLPFIFIDYSSLPVPAKFFISQDPVLLLSQDWIPVAMDITEMLLIIVVDNAYQASEIIFQFDYAWICAFPTRIKHDLIILDYKSL